MRKFAALAVLCAAGFLGGCCADACAPCCPEAVYQSPCCPAPSGSISAAPEGGTMSACGGGTGGGGGLVSCGGVR
jgi:hypothetical protein